jgi:hypothetical protein
MPSGYAGFTVPSALSQTSLFVRIAPVSRRAALGVEGEQALAFAVVEPPVAAHW